MLGERGKVEGEKRSTPKMMDRGGPQGYRKRGGTSTVRVPKKRGKEGGKKECRSVEGEHG